MDIKTVAERSANMAKIHSKDTKPEVFIRSSLHKLGFRFRVADASVFGKPDLYFSRKRVTVFVHGCYWHRHEGCKYAYTPKSNVSFWQTKFSTNILRDETVKAHLLGEGLRVLIIWECTVKRMMHDEETANTVLMEIVKFLSQSDSAYLEL